MTDNGLMAALKRAWLEGASDRMAAHENGEGWDVDRRWAESVAASATPPSVPAQGEPLDMGSLAMEIACLSVLDYGDDIDGKAVQTLARRRNLYKDHAAYVAAYSALCAAAGKASPYIDLPVIPPAQDQGEGEPKPSFPPMPSGKPPHGVYG